MTGTKYAPNGRATMKAVVTTGHGGYDRLDYRDVPIPVPLPGEVLLQVLGLLQQQAGVTGQGFACRCRGDASAATLQELDAQ